MNYTQSRESFYQNNKDSSEIESKLLLSFIQTIVSQVFFAETRFIKPTMVQVTGEIVLCLKSIICMHFILPSSGSTYRKVPLQIAIGLTRKTSLKYPRFEASVFPLHIVCKESFILGDICFKVSSYYYYELVGASAGPFALTFHCY